WVWSDDGGEPADHYWRQSLRAEATRRAKHYGQEGPVYRPVPGDRQREAVRFLNEHAFRPPEYLLDPTILRRIEHEGAMDRVRARQVGLLERLLENDRLGRLVEQAAVGAVEGEPYRLLSMLEDVRRGVWSELYAGAEIGPYRRNLQRAWIELMGVKLETESPGGVVRLGPGSFRFGPQPPSYPNDIRSAARGELREIRSEIEARLSDVEDRATRL
ncbi:MAG: zinc-dependent metalloprotease, partial [Gemmatimonadota bacterium]